MLAVAAMLPLGGAASAEVLIVRSSGPSASSYPPGRQLPDASKISLKANDMLVLLDGSGTRTLRGPGEYSATGSSGQVSDVRTTLAALTSQRSERRARIGAVRQFGSPTIWYTDVNWSGRVCIRDESDVTLWRPESDTPMVATITGANGKATVSWPGGEPTAAWPTTLKIVPGSAYTLSWKGVAKPRTISFVSIGADPGGLEDTAGALIRNGCQAQLDLLIKTVALPDAKPGAKG